MGLAANSITPTEATTAATITPIWSTMPTAVITESSENTMSMTAIWPMMPQKSLLPLARSAAASLCAWAVVLARFHFHENLVRGLVEQEQAAEQQHQVAPADALSKHA